MFRVLRGAAAKLNRHLGMSIGQTYLYRLSRAGGWTPTDQDARLTWELLTPSEVGKLAEIGWFDESEGRERLRRGDRCYTVSLDGRLAHYSWVQRSACHPITEAGVSVPVGHGTFWIYHCRTAEWARGQGIYPSTLQRIVQDCFAEGDFTAWIYTSKQNVASQKGIVRAGFDFVTTLRAFRMGSQYFPLGARDYAFTAVQPIQRAVTERRSDPPPTFVSPSTVDRRAGTARWDSEPARRPERVGGRGTASRSEL